MYGMNFSGGRNRTHGQVEQAERIDSFEAGKVEPDDWRTLYVHGGEQWIPLDCWHARGPDRETVELSQGQLSVTLELTRTPSGFGGSCAYWLCPHCGRRARFLHFKGRGFVCRGCARLNYASQQRTHDSTDYAYDGFRLAREKLRWKPSFQVVPADFPYMTPERPKGMHQTTYRRYLARYRRYQEKYRRDTLRALTAILGRRSG